MANFYSIEYELGKRKYTSERGGSLDGLLEWQKRMTGKGFNVRINSVSAQSDWYFLLDDKLPIFIDSFHREKRMERWLSGTQSLLRLLNPFYHK